MFVLTRSKKGEPKVVAIYQQQRAKSLLKLLSHEVTGGKKPQILLGD